MNFLLISFKTFLHNVSRYSKASLIAQLVKNLPAMQETWARKIPSGRKWQPTPVFLSREFQGQRRLAGYCPWGRKSRTRVSN